MENLFLTTLLISVVIGVLIIYHVTPEAAGLRAGGQPNGTSSSKRESTARRDDPSG